MLNKKAIIIGSLGSFVFASQAQAICPVCVVAVGAGLGLSEYLGIDDTIAGAWIGGLLFALSAWTISWFNKKNWAVKYKTGRDFLTFAAYYGLVIWPLAAKDFIGRADNQLFGIDKLLLGIAAGSLVFWGATAWYEEIKKKNGGHARFPFQKVAWPVGALIILSLVFYLLIR